LHAGARFATLPVAAVVALDAAGDAAEADLLSFPLLARNLRLGRRSDRDLAIDSVEDRRAHWLGQLVPRRVEREGQLPGEAVHDPAVPRVRVVAVRFTDEAAAPDAAAW